MTRAVFLLALLLTGCAKSHVCAVPGLADGVPASSYRWAATATEPGCFATHSAVFDLDGSVIPMECEPVDECGGDVTFRCDELLYVAALHWNGSALVGDAVVTRLDDEGQEVCSVEVTVRAEAL